MGYYVVYVSGGGGDDERGVPCDDNDNRTNIN